MVHHWTLLSAPHPCTFAKAPPSVPPLLVYLQSRINAGSLAPSLPFLASGPTFITSNTITTSLPSCCPASISGDNFHLRQHSSLMAKFQIKRRWLVATRNLHRLDHRRPARRTQQWRRRNHRRTITTHATTLIFHDL